ncbi:hypothetical protein GWK47_055242 [Chionoecetes opilio]|uniref:Uncharacterized protein n=1 Tax=Chionoecetes opilio TaxID=41210 RepID=A0A8J4Y5C0_CHIOP|nr:hypothetical protein GWK47_055242 [Chionoecetes opilio]
MPRFESHGGHEIFPRFSPSMPKVGILPIVHLQKGYFNASIWSPGGSQPFWLGPNWLVTIFGPTNHHHLTTHQPTLSPQTPPWLDPPPGLPCTFHASSSALYQYSGGDLFRGWTDRYTHHHIKLFHRWLSLPFNPPPPRRLPLRSCHLHLQDVEASPPSYTLHTVTPRARLWSTQTPSPHSTSSSPAIHDPLRPLVHTTRGPFSTYQRGVGVTFSSGFPPTLVSQATRWLILRHEAGLDRCKHDTLTLPLLRGQNASSPGSAAPPGTTRSAMPSASPPWHYRSDSSPTVDKGKSPVSLMSPLPASAWGHDTP